MAKLLPFDVDTPIEIPAYEPKKFTPPPPPEAPPPSYKSTAVAGKLDAQAEFEALSKYMSDFAGGADLDTMLASRPGTGLLPSVESSPEKPRSTRRNVEDTKSAKETPRSQRGKSKDAASQSQTPRLPCIDRADESKQQQQRSPDSIRRNVEERLGRLDQVIARAERANKVENSERTMAAVYGVSTSWKERDWKGPPRRHSQSPQKRSNKERKPQGSLTAR
jgi:hypothetical protein